MGALIYCNSDEDGESWGNTAFVKRIRFDPHEDGLDVVLEMADGKERISVSASAEIVRQWLPVIPAHPASGIMIIRYTMRDGVFKCWPPEPPIGWRIEYDKHSPLLVTTLDPEDDEWACLLPDGRVLEEDEEDCANIDEFKQSRIKTARILHEIRAKPKEAA